MAICLRKISGLSSVKLIDASWIWTEPHSQRLKVKLLIQKEVMNGLVLQQSTIVEFVIRNQQCVQCQASFAQGAWHSIVQVRQRASHKRTFFFLEQILLRYNAHADCVNIVVRHTCRCFVLYPRALYVDIQRWNGFLFLGEAARR